MAAVPVPSSVSDYTTGGVIIALAYITWQILKSVLPSLSKRADDKEKRLVDVIERNAIANEKLASNVSENTNATKEIRDEIKSSKQREDLYTSVLIEVMRASGRAPQTVKSATQDPPSVTTTTTTKQ